MAKFLNVDLDGQGADMANLIANGATANELRTNATLQKDEWKELDTEVVDVARKRLRIVAALRARGLTMNLTNAMGTLVLERETNSDMNDAEINMYGATKTDNDAIEYDISYLPIPIASKGFQINARKLAASRRNGQPLDTTQAGIASFKVAEAIEKMTMTGTGGVSFGGGVVYGIENHPNVVTGSLTSSWANSSARDPLEDVLAMQQALVDIKQFGPYALVVPTKYNKSLGDDYVNTTSTTISVRQRLLQLEGIEDIIVSDHATSTKISMVQLQKQTVRMIVGQDPVPVEWNSGDKMMMYFRVMSIMVPDIRADYDGNCGIAVYSE